MNPKQKDDTAKGAEQPGDPLDPTRMASLKHWGKPMQGASYATMGQEVVVDCGWGRLIFGQTFQSPRTVATELQKEESGRRDVAMYIRDPHLVLSYAPQDLFLDPSLTLRLDFRNYRAAAAPRSTVTIRPISTDDNPAALNRIYLAHGMIPARAGFYEEVVDDPTLHVLVARDGENGAILGAVTGVDHLSAFNDPDNGSSLWSLAVDPQATIPGIGIALVRALAELFIERGRAFMDLSVLHDNESAIDLYRKLGFVEVPVYCLKNRNSINELLFMGPEPEESLNIYARIIVDEARRRGIGVEILDADNGFFRLTMGGRSVTCRESLSEMTTAIAMSRCDDKAVTRKVLNEAGLLTPDQVNANDTAALEAFLTRHRRVVVKPARGEQGRGVQVDLTERQEIDAAIAIASRYSDKVVVEEMVRGDDLRIIVIEGAVIAASIRRPPTIKGDGKHSIAELIDKQSRRRAAATQGESRIPVDDETRRCVAQAGHELTDILPEGVHLRVRKTANLHTGGTIHDVTDRLHPALIKAAETGARALDIPVVGFDFMVPDIEGPDYVIIEANERPGLANHEPQPTAERFVDLLFPQTRAQQRRERQR